MSRRINADDKDEKHNASAKALAAGGDSPESLELLLKYKGDPNMTGPGQEAAVTHRCRPQSEKNIDLLLRCGADINGVDRTKSTAGNKAARLDRFELVAYFARERIELQFTGPRKKRRRRPWHPA